MHIVKLDLKHGSTSINSAPIVIDEKGALVGSITKLCSPPIQTSQGRIRYQILGKVSIFGQSADGIIEVREEASSLTFLFDLIEFFEASILESKIIKTCEKSLNIKFMSNHPSTAFFDCEWGSAMFFYDAKQGDLSLEIIFNDRSHESALKS